MIVHGGFAGGWAGRTVADCLRAAGHIVPLIGALSKANFTVRLVSRLFSNDAAKVAAGIPKLGAEYLPRKGSFLLVEGGRILRLQGYYLTSEEVAAVVGALRNRYGRDGAEKG